MTVERFVPVPGLVGPMTSSRAGDVATRMARDFEPGVRAWRVGSDEGCDEHGRSFRWELRFDLPERRTELVVTIGFPPFEESGARGGAVASVRLLPFPAEGSELARMERAGQITRRRMRGVWRQHMRDRLPLPEDFPDSTVLSRVVGSEVIRSVHALTSRMRGPVWVVETPGRTRHFRLDDFVR
ncbi:MAG TPA: hypothetical protein VLB67_15830 [Acidimicrobiia bacterium]|nr:hypothetical protein [Acidimicrobiia bacterium]